MKLTHNSSHQLAEGTDAATTKRDIRKIVSDRARPKVRTVYHRTAFQHAHDNDVRITLDRNLHYFAEEEGIFDQRGEWRSTTSRQTATIYSFPYCVLEIKLREEFIEAPPAWLQDITGATTLDDEEQMGELVLPVFKYSKFGSAIFSCFKHDAIFTPFWVEPRADELLSHTVHGVQGGNVALVGGSALVVAATDKTSVSSRKCSDNDVSTAASLDELERGERRAGGEKEQASTSETKTKAKPGLWSFAALRSVVSKEKKQRPAASSSSNLAVRSVKVEPKTFFANERTYLQWFSAATWIVSAAIVLLELSEQGAILGVCLICYAGILSMYALYVYYQRLRSIINHDKDAIFYDVYGPPVLAVGLFVAVGIGLLVDFLEDGRIGIA